MRLRKYLFCGIATGTLLAGSAQADLAHVVIPGTSFDMAAAPVEGLFADGSATFSESDLLVLHNFVNGNGVATEDKLTFVLVGTGEGLAFVSLYDKPSTDSGGESLMASLSWATATLQGSRYIGTEAMEQIGAGVALEIVANTWQWDVNSEAEAMAVTDFQPEQWIGNMMAWGSSREETLAAPLPMQFISWTGSELVVMAEDEASILGQYAFGYMISYVIPAPGALGLLVLAGLTPRRRRRV